MIQKLDKNKYDGFENKLCSMIPKVYFQLLKVSGFNIQHINKYQDYINSWIKRRNSNLVKE